MNIADAYANYRGRPGDAAYLCDAHLGQIETGRPPAPRDIAIICVAGAYVAGGLEGCPTDAELDRAVKRGFALVAAETVTGAAFVDAVIEVETEVAAAMQEIADQWPDA